MATPEQIRAAQQRALAKGQQVAGGTPNVASPSSTLPSSGMSSTYSRQPSNATRAGGAAPGLNQPRFTNRGSTLNQAGLLNQPQQFTSGQTSAQQWINDPRSGQGGLQAYTGRQQERFNQALATGDQDLLNRLRADAQRVGYNLQDQTMQQPAVPGQTPQGFASTDYINQLRALAEQGARAQAYEASNLADVQSLQGGQRLQEVLSARGLGASGENITASAQQQAARQGALADIQNQLAAGIRDIGSQANQQLLADLYRSQDIAREQEQRKFENQLALGGLIGTVGGQQTLAGRQFASDEAQRAFQQQFAQQQFEQDVQAQQFQQQFAQQQFAYQQARDKIGDQQYKQQFDEDRRRFGLEYALNSAVQNRQLSQADARIALDRAQEARISAGGGGGGSTGGQTKASSTELNSIEKNLLQRFGLRNEKGTYLSPTNPPTQAKLIDEVFDLNLPDNQTESLLRRFGISLNDVDKIYEAADTRDRGNLR